MNLTTKKIAIASILAAGVAWTLTLQAHEASNTHMGSAAEKDTTMPMDSQNMQGMGSMMNMMGMSEQMDKMMSACMKMMAAHADAHPIPSGKNETQG